MWLTILILAILTRLYTKFSLCYADTVFKEDLSQFLSFLSGIVIAIAIFGIYYSINDLNGIKRADYEIEKYSKANKHIEEDMDQVIKYYMGSDSVNSETLKVEDITLIASMYPEINSNIWAKEQIKIHSENKEEITKWERKRPSYKKAKWWLNFGK